MPALPLRDIKLPFRENLKLHGDRPIAMEWELEYSIPAALLEEARAA